MNFVKGDLGKRASRIKRAVTWGTDLVLGVVGLGFLKSEIQRISALPHDINNYAYIGLLVAVLLLMGGWILVAHKESDIIGEWLDPLGYTPPDEMLVALGFALILVALVYASRNAVAFGIVYSVYAMGNLFAVIHLRRQMEVIIGGSRKQLAEEPPETAPTWEKAIDVLDTFYLKRPNIERVAGTLVFGVVGLVLSLRARCAPDGKLELYAFFVYSASVVLLEGVVMFFWRGKFYGGIRRVETEWYAYKRRTPSQTTEK